MTTEQQDRRDQVPEPTGNGSHGDLAPADLRARPLDVLMDVICAAAQCGRPSLRPNDLEIMPPLKGDAPVIWSLDPDAETLPPTMLERLRIRPSVALTDLLGSIERQGRRGRVGLAVQEVGVVRQVGDGVASVGGLPQATTDELVLFSNGVQGLVMNLDTIHLDSILLGSDVGIQGGDTVWATGRRIMVPVGDRLLGRVISPLGEPLDDKGALFVDERRFIERQAPGVVERQPVSVPLHTGIKAIDAMIPIGRGQRELIIGDRQTGKTSIALDAIINQRDTGVICIYVSIGQRKSSVLQALRILEEAGALDHTVVMMAPPDDPPAQVYLAPYAGVTIAESFLDRGHDVLIVYDDLSKHADAYRELSLLLRRPPGREAYPGDVFYLHARLLERACALNAEEGGGSITALPIVETRRGNISAYIPTNLISITDGQIYVSAELFNENIKPGVDVGQSVSRVGGAAQTQIMRRVSGQLRLTLSQYQEVAHFARFGTEIDRATRQQITRGERLREVLNQPAYHPLPLARQVLILRAVDLGYLDEIDVDQIGRYEQELWDYTLSEHRGLIRAIEDRRRMTSEIEQDLRNVIDLFSEQFS
jgi:F-type H+/Na+-transporting ATPase subunit alpha